MTLEPGLAPEWHTRVARAPYCMHCVAVSNGVGSAFQSGRSHRTRSIVSQTRPGGRVSVDMIIRWHSGAAAWTTIRICERPNPVLMDKNDYYFRTHGLTRIYMD
jgi:hypothetical protein